MIATFFGNWKVKRCVIIVQTYPRKLSPKPVVEENENNPIFSVLQNPYV